jgi:site-specific DNA-methyltransferase (adenine-specific)
MKKTNELNVIMFNVEDVHPYLNNPRLNHKAVKVVADSIREFGFRNPIVVDKDGVIIVGHTRLEASKMLGYEQVPVIVADDLSPEQVQAFRIMDNKSSEFAEWDYTKLLAEVNDLIAHDYDVELTGFSDVELSNILDSAIEEEKKKEEADKPEMEFTQELLEEHNYVVLYFDNTLDWQVAKEVFNIHAVHGLASTPTYEKKGVGRVVNGAEYVDKLKRLGEK